MKHDTEVTILQALMDQLDAGKNIDAGVQYRMPTADYICPQRAAKEQHHFFSNHPQLVGLSNDLPTKNSFLSVDEIGVPILATRDQNGHFRAFLNAVGIALPVSCQRRGVRNRYLCARFIIGAIVLPGRF